MIESAVTDLPQPDSPTMPSVLPVSTSNEMPSTARTSPSRVEKYVCRSLDLEQRHQVSRVRGSSASRRPSAMKNAQRIS